MKVVLARDGRHAHQGAPDAVCQYRYDRSSRDRKPLRRQLCGLPRSAPTHLSYPCPICNDVRWSIEARLIHIEQAHPHLRKAWERA